ncbi:MAG: sulfurtransferase [Acidimicrobiales bacterium]|jgi:thiosulfate/3-mercaptopyruvate sulfurtransferase
MSSLRQLAEQSHADDVLVDVPQLQALRRSTEPPRLLDVRWRLGDPTGGEQFLAGHIPGACFVDLDRELAAEPSSPQAGRHPLPAIDQLQAAARRWGLRKAETVVVYDDNASMSAARAWWLLRWGGVERVYLLDGGLSAWRAAGGDLATGPELPEPGDVDLAPGHMPTVLIDDVAAIAQRGLLLDARAAERFRGEVEPVDPRAGHIPGAVSAPTTGNLTADGRFRTAGDLEERFVGLGASPGAAIAVYCGSGVTAAHEVAALSIAGLQGALYPGSWSEWSNHHDRPVATGAGPARPSPGPSTGPGR